MLCRACGNEKSQVVRTNNFGCLIIRYRECLNPDCRRVFQTAEEEFGAVESTLSMCKVVAAARATTMQIKIQTQATDGVQFRGSNG